MPCLECRNNPHDVLSFNALEVHTLHIRDFNGERIIQALGEFRNYEICMACAEREVQAFLYPVKEILIKSLPFVILTFAGFILSFILSLNAEMMTAFRVLGPIAVIAGMSGIVSVNKKIFQERSKLQKMNYYDAVKYAAWKLVIKNAPKKYKDNDVTYIEIDDKTLKMNADELALKYSLLPSIAKKAHEIIHKYKME